MPRARGANVAIAAATEATYGVVPAGGFVKLPIVSESLGSTRALIHSDLLGYGREPLDPTYDVVNNAGDVVVPVDIRAIGHWLRLLMGAPVSTVAGGLHTHVFTSGALALPSMSLEVGYTDIAQYSTNYGLRANQIKIAMARSGLLNATVSCIAQGETSPVGASVAGSPSVETITRLAQATGSITNAGAQLASVVSADMTYSNNLEKVETIRADGLIEDADPGMVMASGNLKLRYRDQVLLNLALAGTPVHLTYGWTLGTFGLTFDFPRVFLPVPNKQVAGPQGIIVDYNWEASGATAASCTATLVNDVVAYA